MRYYLGACVYRYVYVHALVYVNLRTLVYVNQAKLAAERDKELLRGQLEAETAEARKRIEEENERMKEQMRLEAERLQEEQVGVGSYS